MADRNLAAVGVALVVVGTAFLLSQWIGLLGSAAYCSVFGFAYLVRSMMAKPVPGAA